MSNFQTLQRAYEILRDPQRRAQYDRTGCGDDESEGFWDAYERYRGVEVTKEDIDAFETEFRESDEERAALSQFYVKKEGDVTAILGFIMCSKASGRGVIVAATPSLAADTRT